MNGIRAFTEVIPESSQVPGGGHSKKATASEPQPKSSPDTECASTLILGSAAHTVRSQFRGLQATQSMVIWYSSQNGLEKESRVTGIRFPWWGSRNDSGKAVGLCDKTADEHSTTPTALMPCGTGTVPSPCSQTCNAAEAGQSGNPAPRHSGQGFCTQDERARGGADLGNEGNTP